MDIDMPSSSNHQWGYEHDNRYENMAFDAAGLSHEQHSVQSDEEPPNLGAANFYEMLYSDDRPLWPGCQNASEFSTAVAMLSLKSKRNLSQVSDSKNSMQPIKKLKKKKSAQSHLPCTIPSDTLQAYTNKVAQPQPIQHQLPPQPQFIQPQSLPRSQPPQQFIPSQPQPWPTPHQSTETMHQPQPRPRTTQSLRQPQSRSAQFVPQPQPTPQSTQSYTLIPTSIHTLSTSTSTSNSSTQSIPQPPPPARSQPQPPPRSLPIPTQAVYMQEYPMKNVAQASSSSDVSEGDDENKIPILPEGDGFDKYKFVVSEIASIIRSNLVEGKPTWKKISRDTRHDWFRLFQKKFTWPPECKDKVRRNFEKRGSAKMSQLMQEARKELDKKPTWMTTAVWRQLKAYWNSSTFKKKSTTNQRNRESLDGASLHTGGSIPHRLHWKRMKEEKGTDPSLTDFYRRTHQKKDQSWVTVHAKAAYDKFEQRKQELSSQTFASIEDEVDNQACIDMPSDLDIWVDTVGKKGKKIFGLGSVSEILIPTSCKSANNSEEVVSLRSQIHALNTLLQIQEQEKLQMKEELNETNRRVAVLMERLGFVASSSHPPSSPQNDNGFPNDTDKFTDEIE